MRAAADLPSNLSLRRRHKIYHDVMAGLVPAHPRLTAHALPARVDARHQAGHDEHGETAPSECA